MSKEIIDSSLLGSPEVQAWLANPEAQEWVEEQRCAAARKAAITKQMDHEDPQLLLDAMGIVGDGWQGDKDEGTLERVFITVDREETPQRGRISSRRKSGAQRRKEKKMRAIARRKANKR